jgi:SAM-dependent methyltransferase
MGAARFDPQSFDHLAEHFDRFVELVGGELSAYLEAVVPAGGGRAVDLGCGTGRHAEFLAGRFQEVLAVDVSAPMLDLARRRRPVPGVTYQHRRLEDVTADRDGTFDLVLSVNTLHHVADLDAALRQLCGLLAPGGQAVLVDIVADAVAADERGGVPRWWWVEEAMRSFGRDVAERRRPLHEAAELLALNLDPGWLAHVTTDEVLTPEAFAARYTTVFPGGAITAMYRSRGLHYADRMTPDMASPDTASPETTSR